jgi:hypothetical protein
MAEARRQNADDRSFAVEEIKGWLRPKYLNANLLKGWKISIYPGTSRPPLRLKEGNDFVC